MLESCCQYNKSMKSWQEENNTEMHLTYNEGKSIVAERFIRTLKNKVYKYPTSIFKKMCIDKLDITSNNYNNINHSTIKIKLVDVNAVHIFILIGNNKEDTKFKVGDHVSISKYNNIYAKDYVPNRSEEAFAIKKVKNTIPRTYVISDVKGKEIVGMSYGKEIQKTIKKEFRIENVIKRNRDKLYAK